MPRPITIGADPEMFVRDSQTLALIPAFDFLPMKHENHYRTAAGGGIRLYADGFAAEWSFEKVFIDLNDFICSTQSALQYLLDHARAHNPNAELTLLGAYKIPQAMMDAARDDQVELGCIPSFNAYGFKGRSVENPRELLWRFTGGHMHFGNLPRHVNYERLVWLLDKSVGRYDALFTHPLRRQYYGQAGEYRVPPRTPAGKRLEYRVPSNTWLRSPRAMREIWNYALDNVRRACTRVEIEKPSNEALQQIQCAEALAKWDGSSHGITIAFSTQAWDLR